MNKNKILFDDLILSKDQALKLYLTYDKIIAYSQKFTQTQLNSQLLLIIKQPQN